MNRTRVMPVALMVASLVVLGGCAAGETSPSDPIDTEQTESSAAPATDDVYLTSLADLAGTEWSGRDDQVNDRITFIFNADGSLSYRNTAGVFATEGDTWSVDGNVVTFQASYGERWGIATHTGTYDPQTGVMSVVYTTSTDRTSTLSVTQVN